MPDPVRYWWIVDGQVLAVTPLSVASWCNDSGARRGRIVLAEYCEACALLQINWQRMFA